MALNWQNMWSLEVEAPPVQQSQAMQEVIERLAQVIVRRGMAAPALVLLDSCKPLTFLGNQLLVFLQPVVQCFFAGRDYQAFVNILADRWQVERLIVAVEDLQQQALVSRSK